MTPLNSMFSLFSYDWILDVPFIIISWIWSWSLCLWYDWRYFGWWFWGWLWRLDRSYHLTWILWVHGVF